MYLLNLHINIFRTHTMQIKKKYKENVEAKKNIINIGI